MACRDCFNNCDGDVTSDKCVKYTGPDIEWLGICTGDQLSTVEAAIIAKLEGLTTGEGVTIEDLETCEVIDDALDGEDPTIKNVLQAILTVICTIQEDVEEIQDETQDPISFDADCLELGDNPTRDEILQAVVSKVCSDSSSIETISGDYVKASELCSLVEECISGSGGDTIQESTKMPKYVALPYHGTLSVFDANGKGLSAFGYDKVYMCIGQTVSGFTLPDYRGRTPVGSNIGMPGAAMDSDVDPALIANTGYNFSAGVKKGNFTNTLTTSQLAAHTHGVTDPGHFHAVTYNSGEADQSESGTSGDLLDAEGVQDKIKNTNSKTTGITITSAGSSQPHNNTQPSMGTVFIMYVPS